MDDNLKLLADKLGVLTEYYDAGQDRKKYEIDEDTIKFFIKKLGYNADTPTDVEHSLVKFDNRRWQETLDSVYVVEQGNLLIDIAMPAGDKDAVVSIKAVSRQNDAVHNLEYDIVAAEEREINHRHYARQNVKIKNELDVGYYDLSGSVRMSINPFWRLRR